jgi:hypothetical protein
MKQETKRTIKKGIANTFGSFGYLFDFLQWIWVGALYLSVIQSLSSIISSSGGEDVERPIGLSLTLPSPLTTVMVGAIVVVMLAITVYAFVSLPRSIVRASNKMVHKTARTMAPVVMKAQHKQDTKRNRIKITVKLVVALKVLLTLIPLLLTVASRLLEEQSIDYSIAMIVGCGLACLGAVCFAIEYLLAAFLRVKMSDLW